MLISPRSDFHPWSRVGSITNRTAVYGSVRTVVWEGRRSDPSPYPDQECVRHVCCTVPHALSCVPAGNYRGGGAPEDCAGTPSTVLGSISSVRVPSASNRFNCRLRLVPV